jgi:hypothetical protein
MERDADALARLEALVKVVEAEARLNGTLHLFEQWKATLPGHRTAAAVPARSRRKPAAPG